MLTYAMAVASISLAAMTLSSLIYKGGEWGDGVGGHDFFSSSSYPYRAFLSYLLLCISLVLLVIAGVRGGMMKNKRFLVLDSQALKLLAR